ncbi:MAG: hypothetical protein COV08_00210 [Candidatus Vogelbacteria bacterium CG10_big_fil_rev_8_21_14_0_10_49_38]|uniref:Type II secretion system protein n=1 Tax=Candidatus Vogelbacteria bacterium CG10_big_fil_rev_8_21_14_0_10_49_38 TaxID=1975043 RepID=A0A2H0RKN1_9BACT|nr:MAG: hypothetical protein BK006_00210 [bacterium CG10_49_38]PIR46345.1 MAG: hypothetical protein COV08_00210 [Candidatus Vogelbacteria bacterium CG10_big_fil_rev_8_21_14_0_10_49_38]
MKTKKSQSGFTLIEAFVAIVVLMIVVLGPMTLLSRSLFDARYIKDEIIATYLAQEGVELMIDKKNNGPGPVSPSDSYNCRLGLSAETGYTCNILPETIFTRAVSIVPLGRGQMEITSIVSRDNSGRSVVSRSIIFVSP